MEKDFEDLVKILSETEVPLVATEYHDKIVQALAEYLDMLKFLLRSIYAREESEKKEYLDKAAAKIQKANELADAANRNINILSTMFNKSQEKP